ncbi:MAG: DUF4349 domain-containing protein [Clostridiales bacterium]|nr:DUF4349 domain-containing protein [Clostridiales bacterium]
MDKTGTNHSSASSVLYGKEASDMMNEPNESMLDAALADLYDTTPSLRFEKNWREAVRREEQLQMKNRKNIWLKTVLPIAAALVLILGAGWAGEVMDDYNFTSDTAARQGSSAKLMANTSYSASSGSSLAGTYGAADTYVEESAEFEAVSYDMAAATGSTNGAVESGMEIPAQDGRKLVRTVDISLRTEHFDEDTAAIQALLAQYGGYVENFFLSGEAGSTYGRNANLTMRVPSQHLDAFVTGVSGFGRITSRSETTEDMTEQYTDNATRIQTLRTKMERLQTLLSKAEEVSDILEIESEIADTQYQLDRYETRQLNIDRRVDMSYVYVNLSETVVQDNVDDEELTLGQRLAAAFEASLEGLVRFGRNLLVFLVMALPVIVPVGVIVLVIVLVRRRKAKAAEADKAAEEPAEEPEE